MPPPSYLPRVLTCIRVIALIHNATMIICVVYHNMYCNNDCKWLFDIYDRFFFTSFQTFFIYADTTCVATRVRVCCTCVRLMSSHFCCCVFRTSIILQQNNIYLFRLFIIIIIIIIFISILRKSNDCKYIIFDVLIVCKSGYCRPYYCFRLKNIIVYFINLTMSL